VPARPVDRKVRPQDSCDTAQLLPDELTQRTLKPMLLDVAFQRLIDETLVVPTPCLIHLRLKPVDDIGIQAWSATIILAGGRQLSWPVT
jgi:hypothetical protein